MITVLLLPMAAVLGPTSGQQDYARALHLSQKFYVANR